MDQLRVILDRQIKLFVSLIGQLAVCPEVCKYMTILFAQQSCLMTILIPMSGKMLEITGKSGLMDNPSTD